MRCWYKSAVHASEDCPAGRAILGSGPIGSGPAGREVEHAVRSSALPLAQAGPEQRVESDEPGSGPARWAAELNGERAGEVTASPAVLPFRPASVDDELELIESSLEGRGGRSFTPTPLASAPSLRHDSYRVRRTDAAEDLVRSMFAAVQLAERQGIETLETDRLDIEALLLHEAALMRVIEWASRNGPECTCRGAYVCPWHAGLADAMRAEETA